MKTVHPIGSDINSKAVLWGWQVVWEPADELTPIAQKPRQIPYPLKDKVYREIDELLNLDILDKVQAQQLGTAQL